MPKLLPCDWLISNLCYQVIEQVYLIKWPVSVCVCVCIYMYMYIYSMYIYIYIYIYICIYTVCIYIALHWQRKRLWVQFPGNTHTDKKYIAWIALNRKSLWIKASAKCINVSVNMYVFTHLQFCTFKMLNKNLNMNGYFFKVQQNIIKTVMFKMYINVYISVRQACH